MPTLETRTVAELELTVEGRQRLEAALSTYTMLKEDLDLLTEQADIEKSKIGKALADAGIDNSRSEKFALIWVRGSQTTKLDPKKLIAQGVTTAMIENATVSTPRKDYFQIRALATTRSLTNDSD